MNKAMMNIILVIGCILFSINANALEKQSQNSAVLASNTSFPTPVKSIQLSIEFSKKAGTTRSFYLSLPKNFQPQKPYKLLFVFPGTDTTGKEMFEFAGVGWPGVQGIEENMPNTIFVYPDPKWRYFKEWKNTFGGWLLGPYGAGAAGDEDMQYVAELLDWLQNRYNIDAARVFATGHSWGGDMAAVAGCFLGNRFAAIAPVAANRPHWVQPDNGTRVKCEGRPAVWTFYGLDDEHYADQQSYSGEFGILQNNYWRQSYSCSNNRRTLPLGRFKSESFEYSGCTSTVRFTLYTTDFSGISNQPGHQPPDFYNKAVADWFSSF